MEIRILKPEENVLYGLISSVCFTYPLSKDYSEKLKNPLEHTENHENKIGCFNDKGELQAALVIVPYKMQFNGETVDMAGIQGVATAPEARFGGMMSKGMTESLRIMHDRGYLLSTLYPFSFAYYRKFGYEQGYNINKASIDIDAFRSFPFPEGNVRLWKKGDDTKDLAEVYESFIKSRNYAINRNKENWGHILKDPYLDMTYTYIHYDDKGSPDSYIIFSPKKSDDDVAVISEFAWKTKAGLFGMFGFISGLRPQFSRIKWGVPDDIDVTSIFPEATHSNIRIESDFMVRIINLQGVLERLRPLGSGKVILDIHDKSFDLNTGVYEVSWGDGIKVNKTDASPDISTTIETMAQLAIGYSTPQQAAYKTDTTIHKNMDGLSLLFPKRNLYIWEKF